MATEPDWTDPCAVYNWLSAQYPKVIAGVSVASMTHGDTSRSFSRANSREMAALMRQKYAECQASKGKTGRRAIIAG